MIHTMTIINMYNVNEVNINNYYNDNNNELCNGQPQF